MIALLGVPWDGGASFERGAAAGPAAIRRRLWSAAGNGHAESGRDALAALVDCGDAEFPPDETAALAAIQVAAEQAAELGPVLALGGDHSVSLPLLRAVAARHGALHVLHVDAHPDLYPELDGRRYSNASPFARAFEEGLLASLTQLGIRADSPPQRAMARRWNVVQHGPDAIAGFDPAALQAPLYVSIDIDGFDPAFAPGVSHPEAGGLLPREVLSVLRRLPHAWVGADVVEVVPARDAAGITAVLAAKLVKELVDAWMGQRGMPRATPAGMDGALL
jgi:agmatinase